MNKDYKDDEGLLLEIKTGDQTLLKNLYRTYWGPFKAFVIKLYDFSDEEIADIYAQTFTTFYFNIKDGKLVLPLRSKLKTYLFGIGLNYIRKKFDKQKKEKMDFYPDLQEVQEVFQQPDVVNYYELEWQKNMIQKLLKKLAESCRKILMLSFIEENSDDAISVKLNINSVGAVRQRRFNCLEKLRKLVKQDR